MLRAPCCESACADVLSRDVGRGHEGVQTCSIFSPHVISTLAARLVEGRKRSSTGLARRSAESVLPGGPHAVHGNGSVVEAPCRPAVELHTCMRKQPHLRMRCEQYVWCECSQGGAGAP